MITETLWLGHLTFPAGSFQTQLLKVVFTTLYVDVKEPALRTFQPTKKPNFVSRLSPPLLNAQRDKPGQN